MAIEKMTKFHLLSFKESEDKVLKKLQNFQYVHLTSLDTEDDVEVEASAEDNKIKEINVKDKKDGSYSKELSEASFELESVKSAIKMLSSYDERPKGIKGLKEGNPNILFSELEGKFNDSKYREGLDRISEIKGRIDDLISKDTKLKSDLEETEKILELKSSPKEAEELKYTQSLIGSVPKKLNDKFFKALSETENLAFTKIGETKDEFFYNIVYFENDEEKIKDILRENTFSEYKPEYDEIPSERRRRLKKEINRNHEEVIKEKEKFKALNSYLPDLEIAYEYLNNKILRLAAKDEIYSTRYLNIMSGYIPTRMEGVFKEELRQILGDAVYVKFTPAEEGNTDVPTLLNNNKVAASFENLTQMYGTPVYGSLDPTPIMTPFYIMFFGMMLADAGYGLLMLIGTAIALKFFNLSEKSRNAVRFFFYLSFAVIFVGILYGSYFSLNLKVWKLVDPGVDFMKIMVVSIGMGLIHMFLALGIKAYMMIKDGDYLGALYDVGFWYMALIGAILFGLSGPLGLAPIVKTIAKWVMIVGMLGIVFFTARDAKTKGGRFAGGLYNLYGMSGWIGDFVSYSRLMALGLSGGFIGMAINMIAKMVAGNKATLIFAAIIFVGGHIFNLFIGALGAYVHTARLNYVEFFGKFFDGSGKKFKKFRSEEKYVNYR